MERETDRKRAEPLTETARKRKIETVRDIDRQRESQGERESQKVKEKTVREREKVSNEYSMQYTCAVMLLPGEMFGKSARVGRNFWQ